MIRDKNPIETLFKDVKNFDAQKPVIGSLIKKRLMLVKKKDLSRQSS